MTVTDPNLPPAPRRSATAQALRIAGAYALVAGIWIIGSDQVLGWLFRKPERLTLLQTFKGWFFIVVTAGLLFVILRRRFRIDGKMLAHSSEQHRRLQALSQFQRSVIDNASIWINVLDPEARVTLWNKAAEQISGYSRDDVLGNADIWERLYPDPDYRMGVSRKVMQILGDGLEVEGFETVIRCRDGQEKTISWHSRRFVDEHGRVGSIAIGLDYTRRHEIEQALSARERQLTVLMANVPGMVYRCSLDGHRDMSFVSSGSLALTGYPPEALVGSSQVSWSELVLPDDLARVTECVRQHADTDEPLAIEYRIRHRDGQVVWVWEQSRAVRGNLPGQREGIIVNITERKEMEHKLEQLAVRDPLTGLLNRRELSRVLDAELAHANRDGEPLSLLLVDIDNFKHINDHLGHQAGDEVLQRVARLVLDSIRRGDHAARYGGDELVLVLPGMDAAGAMTLATRLKRAAQASPMPHNTAGHGPVGLTIGVATSPQHGRDGDVLLAAADRAMYAGKKAGRNRVVGAVITPD